MSQQQLADGMSFALGVVVHQSAIHRWETGTMPRRRWLLRLKSFTQGEVGAEDFV